MAADRPSNTRFRCGGCRRVFGEHQALCEDWSDPSRSFICPGCQAYLLRADVAGVTVLEHRGTAAALLARHGLVLSLASAVLAASFLVERTAGEFAAVGWLLLGSIGVGAFALLRRSDNPPVETVRVEDLAGPRGIDRLH